MHDMTRSVLVTGASAGIGYACAGALHAAGWAVTAASRRGTGPAGCAAAVMNVDDDDSVRACVAGVLAERGRIDAVVTAAGWGLAGAAERCSVAEAKAQLETNFWGSVRVAQEALPAMRAQGAGRIVLISSIGGAIGIPYQAFYSASKFALEGYGEALAYEVAPFGIQVTLVQPGNVRTDFTDSRVMAQAAKDDDIYGQAAARAIGRMERDERNGVPSGDVGDVVLRVLGAARPPRRVSVGKANERVALVARRLLPFRLFEASARSSLAGLADPQCFGRRQPGRPQGRVRPGPRPDRDRRAGRCSSRSGGWKDGLAAVKGPGAAWPSPGPWPACMAPPSRPALARPAGSTSRSRCPPGAHLAPDRRGRGAGPPNPGSAGRHRDGYLGHVSVW